MTTSDKTPPDKLRLLDGQLVCNDGSDVKDYLRAWARSQKITSDTPINLIDSNTLNLFISDHLMLKCMGA